MPRKPIIPFWMMPGSWGLKGKTREIAQAEYELDQDALAEKLLEINHRDDPNVLAQKKLDLMLSSDNIGQYDYARQVVTLTTKDSTAREMAMLDIDLKYEKISQLEYDRKKADLLKEPWVAMPKIHWNPLGKARAYFEMDYNEYFITQLKENGYEGSEPEMVNQWMNDVCVGILEEINDMDAEYATPSRRSNADLDI